MKQLLLITLFYAFTGCSFSGDQSNFQKFHSNFDQVSLPLTINDSLAFESWNAENLIDTNCVKEFHLVSRYFNKQFSFKSIKDFKCSYVGKLQSGNYLVLLYKSFTSEAGSGNPEIVLASFSRDGEKKDQITALWNNAEDPLFIQRNTLNIPDDKTIIIRSIIKINGYLDGKIVPKKVTEKAVTYSINADGKIVVGKEITKDLFQDNNPAIVDDFSENR